MRIGAWSMLLLVLALQLLGLACALILAPKNRLANRLLAAALVVIAGLLTPYIIGYAGAYDSWPWLSFAPFAVPLALGPLLYAYLTRLAEDRALDWRHWLAPAAQFLLMSLVFPWPTETKNWFDATVQEPFLSPLISAAVLASMGGYGWAGLRMLRRYEDWLRSRRRDTSPTRRLRTPVLVLAGLVVARSGYELWNSLIAPVDYFDQFGYYIGLGAAGLWIGLDGWRGAHQPLPAMHNVPERDWAAEGARWIARLEQAGWWRDEALDLDQLARELGTNVTQLSRALNAAEGSFPVILGRIRAEAVAARLDAGETGELLGVAFDCGFGSKASFNRAFKARFGISPSEYREGAKPASLPLNEDLRRVES
jgi:AraC-like DNA-binding protein